MAMRPDKRTRRSSGTLTTELLVAMGILAATLIPLAYSFVHEHRLARAYYLRAVAMEVVDGEFERLRSGGWKALSEGQTRFVALAESVKNLGPGSLFATRSNHWIRLEWRPQRHHDGGAVVREGEVR